jgi:hypothetical protein
MKTLFCTIAFVAFISVLTVKAQTKAQQDNGQYIAVVQTQKTIGRAAVTHYTMTNNSAVSMDFTLYKQQTNGSWLTTRSLNLAPGGTYDDEGSSLGMNGKYILYSAPHSAMADFPSFHDIASLQSGAPVAIVTTPTPVVPATTPAATTPATTPQTAPGQTQAPPPTPNTAPPGNPRPVL